MFCAFVYKLTVHASAVANKARGLSGKYQHEIKVKTDRHRLSMWLLWSRRIVAFKLYLCSIFNYNLFVRNIEFQ